MYRNCEGYADPTAGAALAAIAHEQNRKERAEHRKAQHRGNQKERGTRTQEYRHCPKIYVVSPYGGHVTANKAAAVRYCQYVITQGKQPLASHLLYPQILDDNNPQERELGLLFGQSLMALCDEVWVFGAEPSSGMNREIEEAKRLGKPIRRIGEVDV